MEKINGFESKKYIVGSLQQSEEAISSFTPLFSDMPIVLIAQDARGTPTYRGRKGIVSFLTNIHISQISWKEYTFN